ncbi:MAG: hypothetical protein LBP92_11310 [Deltaproteobacteria bacterium]|jgi:hypothetical protein|nr:hypothetical protein [Deltaproteobacteria bacterium]
MPYKSYKYAFSAALDTGSLPARMALGVASRIISTASSVQAARDILDGLLDSLASVSLHGYRVLVYPSPDGAYDSESAAFVAAGMELEHERGILAGQDTGEDDG